MGVKNGMKRDGMREWESGKEVNKINKNRRQFFPGDR